MIECASEIKKGDEVFVSYGYKTKAKMLMWYGFFDESAKNEYPLMLYIDPDEAPNSEIKLNLVPKDLHAQ